MATVWECFLSAAAVLASAGSVKQRLADAYASHLADIDQEDLPRELREEFMALGGSLSSMRPLPGETAVQATVRKMSETQAAQCAQRIIDLLGSLTRLQMHQPRPVLRAVNGDD
jgi:hypothetical protein